MSAINDITLGLFRNLIPGPSCFFRPSPVGLTEGHPDRVIYGAAQGMVFVLLSVLSICGCSGCGGGSDAADSGGGDADTDTDTDIDTDTDTLDYDGGPYTECEVSFDYSEVCIPGGRYLMGCMSYDTQCDDEELPLVEVTLSPFLIDRVEATWDDVIPFLNTLREGYVRGPGGIGTIEEDPKTIAASIILDLNEDDDFVFVSTCGRDSDAAAGGFSWYGAKLYCEWKGKTWATEAQWEAAARGPTRLIYPCAWQHLPCWYGKYDCCSSYDSECFHPSCDSAEHCCMPYSDEHIAKCYSPLGVHAMYGNASEWVLDWMDDGDDHSWCADGCTASAPRTGVCPILKGGGVDGRPKETRISNRRLIGNGPDDCDRSHRSGGIRCVRSAGVAPPDAGIDGGE